ncbi:MAG: PAS domain S-box protein [Candidatus Thorarchaeota archaeon]
MSDPTEPHRALEICSQEDLLQYRALLEALNNPFAVADEKNRLTYVNKSFAAMLEYEQDEMVGRKIGDFLDPANRAIQEQAIERRTAGETSRYPLEWIAKSGRKVHTIVSGVPILDEECKYNGAFAVITDISAQVEAERRYRILAEQSLQALTVIQDSKYKYVNPAFASMLGYTRNEILKMDPDTAFKLIHEEDRSYLLRLAEDRRAGRRVPVPHEYRLVCKNGSTRWVQAYTSQIVFEGRPATQVLIIDVTEAKEAQKKLRESQEMLRIVMNTVPQFVFWKDLESVYLGCNENFARVAGIEDTDNIQGMKDTDLAWREEEAARLRRIDRRVIESDSAEHGIVMTQHQADGNDVWIELSVVPLHDEDGKVIGVLGSYDDITEKRRAQDELRKSEEKYRNLAEHSLQSITIMSESRLLYYNQAFKNMIGYSDAELEKMSMSDVWNLVHPEDRVNMRKHITDALANRPVPHDQEYRFVRKDGTVRWVECFSTKVDFEGEPAIQTLFVDVTDRIEGERQLDSAKDRALLYLDILGHDIAQQLQVILNSAALMNNATDDKMKDSFLNIIGDAVRKASRMIDRAKSTEMLLSVPLSERSLGAALGTCVEALSDRTKGVSFELKIQVVDSNIFADQYLELLITQLLVNAVEHNPSDNKRVWVTLSDTETGFIVSIADNGPGIPDTIKGGLFDMSRRYGGLGLHSANQIVEKYRGRIEVHDRVPGDHTKGAEFRLWFPKLYRAPGSL